MFTNLLKRKRFDGYPTGFVLSRLRGRGYCTPDASAGTVANRRELDREYTWIYALLDRPTTRTFLPFFTLFEIERLLACLRLERGSESNRVESLLAESLLSAPVSALLVSKRSHAEKAKGVIARLEVPTPTSRRMERLLDDKAWTNFEASFVETGLRWALETTREETMKSYFRARIDMRNLQALYKAVRWRSATEPPFVEGALIGRRTIRRMFQAGDLEMVEESARRRLAGRPTGPFECDLFHGLALQLHRQSLREGGRTTILSHLWGLQAALHEQTGRNGNA